jgi:hypothetical protein
VPAAAGCGLSATTPLAEFAFLPDADQLPESTLLARVELMRDRIVVHSFFNEGGPPESWVVHPDVLASAFAGRQAVHTGLLGPDTLFVAQVGATTYTGVWAPPRRRAAAIMRGGVVTHRFVLPMPGALAVTGSDRRFAVFAAPTRPERGAAGLEQALQRFPAFNLHENETICVGSHAFSGDPWRTIDEFFESFFAPELTGHGRSRRYPGDLLALWEELDRREAFPVDDLVPVGDGHGRFTLAGLFRWLGAGMPHSVAIGLVADPRGQAAADTAEDQDDADDGDTDDEDWEGA